MRASALIALLLLAGCNRPRADQPMPGGDGEAQAATAAKTLADLRAADEASQGPAPEIAPAMAPRAERAAAEPVVEAESVADEGVAEATINETSPQ